MTIQLSSKIKNSSALVIFLKNKRGTEKHPFLRTLSNEDRNYIKHFLDKNANEDLRALLLPSGRKTIIVLSKERKKFALRKVIISMRRIIMLARREKIKEITVNLEDFILETRDKRQETREIAELLATQFELANFEFNAYKTKPKGGWNFVSIAQIYADLTPRHGSGRAQINADEVKQALRNGKIIGEEINKARALANMPPGDMTPRKLAEAARKSGRECGFKVSVLEESQIKKLGMGGIIGVSRGSAERPRFIIMEYLKGGKGKPSVIVGKGVTFDSGGLNLKPSNYIYEMHMDMSGGAATIHTVAALARMKVKKNIIGLVPAVENMPSGSSYHPGDVLKTMNGKTIEVLNTDAEGRVILADALEYSKKYNPKLVIDIATLTGAAHAALGSYASAIFSTDKKIEEGLIDAGEKTGDYLWPLPLWEEFEEEIKGTFGDFANSGKSRYGDASVGAVFLWQFIKRDKRQETRDKEKGEIPWVHLDIAPRMTSIESDSLAKGAAGASIAPLVYFLK